MNRAPLTPTLSPRAGRGSEGAEHRAGEGAGIIVKTLEVGLGNRAYPIDIGHGVLLREHGIGVDVVLLPDGEAHKNATTLHDLLTRLLELRVERSTPLIALGGGVVGDIAGF